jgi:hypothetical protein
MTATDWWSNSEDDDLQKALRASLADMEGDPGADSSMADLAEDGEALPEDVTEAYQKVVKVWERDKRIFWTACDDALDHALQHRDARATLVFINQMVPEIVSICLQECTWADIVEDAVTKEDYTVTFTRILHACVTICIGSVRQGSSDLTAPLNMLLDPMAQLYTKHARTNLSDADCPPSPTLLAALVHHATTLGGSAHVLACLEHWPWSSVLPGLRFMRTCGDEGLFGKALGVLQQRILIRGLDVWREDGKTLGEIICQLSTDTATFGPAAALSMREIGRQVAAIAVQGSRSEKFLERTAALPAMLAVIESKALADENGDGACRFLDEQGVLEDLFGERAHERIIQEAAALLRAVRLTPGRLDVVLAASFNAHDDTLATAATSVLVSLVESADVASVLHVLARCEIAIADDLPCAHAAFELSMQLVAARSGGSDSGKTPGAATVSLANKNKPLLIVRGTELAQAALRLCCEAACSPLAGAQEKVLTSATEALHDLLKANTSSLKVNSSSEEKQHQQDFVLTYCVDVLRTLQDGLQKRLSPCRPAPLSSAAAARDKGGGVAPVAMIRGTVAGREMEGGGGVGGGWQGAEERYRIKARAVYAILRGVIDMHPVACTAVVRRSRSMCVQQLEKDHNIVQHIIDDVTLLAASLAAATPTTSLTRSNSQTQFLVAVASPFTKGTQEGMSSSGVAAGGVTGGVGRSGFIGSECWARLEFLRFFLETSDGLKLSAAQALCLWEALQESSIETACCWFRLLQDAGGLLHSEASDAIFTALLQLQAHAYTSLHVLDSFLAYFADVNAEMSAARKDVRGSAVLRVLGRDGKRPGGRLTGHGLVGRRIAVRSSDDNKMHPATVTGYDTKQWLKHSIVWDAGGDEARKTLHGHTFSKVFSTGTFIVVPVVSRLGLLTFEKSVKIPPHTPPNGR